MIDFKNIYDIEMLKNIYKNYYKESYIEKNEYINEINLLGKEWEKLKESINNLDFFAVSKFNTIKNYIDKKDENYTKDIYKLRKEIETINKSIYYLLHIKK